MAVETDPRVVNNPEQRRYELWLGATCAGFIDYLSEPGTILLIHTEVDPTFEGQGLGGRLVAGALDDLGARDLKVVPLCPFVRTYLRRHPEYADLVVNDRAAPQ
jgi:predicted GNAT family acetyltransferase